MSVCLQLSVCGSFAANPKVIFERCLNQLAGVQPTIANNYETYRRCSTLAEFVRHLRDLVKADRQRPRYIVIDQCERMRELGSTVLATFLRLGELVSCRAPSCILFL